MLREYKTNTKLKYEITEKLLTEDQIWHYVYYDALTELSNRKKMREDVDLLLNSNNKKFAFLFLDLDKFKSVNDIYGHLAGDNILETIAVRLKSLIRSIDTVYRIGGDEFIIILRNLKTRAHAEKIAIAALNALSTAFCYKENQLFIGVSIGISIFPEHGIDEDTLSKNANFAMYEVKNRGGQGYIIYDNIMNDNIIHMLETEKCLKNAMEKNEFRTYYQPILDLNSMKVLSSESLVRWKREEKVIQPSEFIPIAKKIGKMVEIDNWMIYNACAQCKKWQKLGANNFSISINTSYKQLIQPDFVQLVMNILHEQLLDPGCLNLEIPEDEAMGNIDLIVKVLLELKSQGIKISIDDFGTGYSSLSWLSNLPVDTIKIDRSLIINLDTNSKNIAIIKAIIAVANSLKIKVIAEGIETETELATLKELRCDYIQGYLIGKPMAATEFEHKFI